MNTKLIAELIERGDLNGVKEAMEKSMTAGSQTFEQDLARLIRAGIVSRDEALLNSDSPTNLMWRLQNDNTPITKAVAAPPQPEDVSDEATFTEISLDVHAEAPAPAPRPSLFPKLSA